MVWPRCEPDFPRSTTPDPPKSPTTGDTVEDQHERVIDGVCDVGLAWYRRRCGMRMKCADNLLSQSLRGGDNPANVRTRENETPRSPRHVACLHQRQMESGIYDESANLSAWNCTMGTTRLPEKIGELSFAECAHGVRSGLTRR